MSTSENGANVLHVQYIRCVNNAGFVMCFSVLDNEGREDGETSNFPINQSHQVDLANLKFGDRPLEIGQPVRPQVMVVLGATRQGPPVRYAPNGQTATFSVRGTTLSYDISL
jgi:hypothetical protein